MAQIKVHNQDGNVTGEIAAPDFLVTKWNPILVHQVFKAMAANLRRPVAHTKGRGEVSGGGKKPWKQKGTGRARQGSIRSPLWRHGGVSHGPNSDREYSQKINEKMARLALLSVLAKKFFQEELKVVTNLEWDSPKTKKAAQIINNLTQNKSTLVVLANENLASARALRNLSKVDITQAKNLNVYEATNHKYLVIEQKALAQIKS